MSTIATTVCGVNIRTMNTSDAPIATSAWNSVWRWARSRSRSSAVSSSSRLAVPAAALGAGGRLGPDLVAGGLHGLHQLVAAGEARDRRGPWPSRWRG